MPLLLLPNERSPSGLPRAAAPTVKALWGQGSEQGPIEEQAHLALPQALGSWEDVLQAELETAIGQDKTAAARGLTLVLKKNGRVGTRRLGTPNWADLCLDVQARQGAGLDVANI